MGLIKPIDVTIVKDREYDVLSALAVNGEYIEEIGEACVNPAGYTQGSIFLARNDVVMHLYKATANITAGQAMTIGTNCELSSLDAMFKKSGQDLDSVKQALANEAEVRAENGAHNLFDSLSFNGSAALTFTKNSDGSVTVNSGTASDDWYFPNNSYKGTGVAIPYKPNTKYVFSIGTETAQLSVLYKATSGSGWTTLVNQAGIAQAEFTTPSSFYDLFIRIMIPSGTVLASNKTFYPMVKLASDKATGYQPFAMTNQQLTGSLNNNFVLVSKNEYVDVQSDGTETNETFFKRLKTAALSLINAKLGTNETFAITGFTYGYRDFRLPPRSSLGGFSDDFYYSIKIEASMFVIVGIQPYAGQYLRFMFYNNQTSITDDKSNTASGACRVVYDVYKKIQ